MHLITAKMIWRKQIEHKEQKKHLRIVSQEEIGKRYFSMWLQADRMAEAAQTGTVFIFIYKKRKQTASASDQHL